MGWPADRAGTNYVSRAIVESRIPLNLTYRLVVRFAQLVTPAGAASAGTGLWHRAVWAFALADVAVWLVLRRTGRYLLWPRLLLDAGDIAFWSLSPGPRTYYDAAVLVGIPLALEAGFRSGRSGMVVPGAALAVTAAVRQLAGKPVLAFTFAWLVLGVGMGMGLFSYSQRLHSEAEADAAARRAARRRRAFLAGQNSVAMGASSVIDRIESLIPILGRPEPGSALWRVADGWKASLGQATSSDATYLQVALLEWEREYNRHPDLASHIRLVLPEGAGTLLLTGPQVLALRHRLDQLRLRGRQGVAIAEHEASQRPPGHAVRLLVGGRPVEVPADPVAAHRPVDAGPLTFVFIAAQMAKDTRPNYGGVPWPVVGLSMVVCLAAGWYAHRLLTAGGVAARGRVLAVAAGVGLFYAAVASPTMAHPYSFDGNLNYGFGAGVMLLAFLAGVYHESLTPHLRAGVAVAMGLMCAVAVVLSPASPVLRPVVTGLAWTLSPYPASRRVSRALVRATTRQSQAEGEADGEAELEAFRQGRDEVLALVRAARDDAVRQLAALDPATAPEIGELATRRLTDVDHQLAVLGAPVLA